MAKCGVTVRQTPHVSSDSSGRNRKWGIHIVAEGSSMVQVWLPDIWFVISSINVHQSFTFIIECKAFLPIQSPSIWQHHTVYRILTELQQIKLWSKLRKEPRKFPTQCSEMINSDETRRKNDGILSVLTIWLKRLTFSVPTIHSHLTIIVSRFTVTCFSKE